MGGMAMNFWSTQILELLSGTLMEDHGTNQPGSEAVRFSARNSLTMSYLKKIVKAMIEGVVQPAEQKKCFAALRELLPEKPQFRLPVGGISFCKVE
jgi:hypothetical protein